MVKKGIYFVIFYTLLFITLPAFADTAYVVKTIIDGDTIILENGKRVRIAYVDTPELEHKKRKRQYFSINAKNFIAKAVLGRKITLQQIVSIDRYKRTVAIVTLPDGRDLGTLLIRNGMGFVYPHGTKHSSYTNKLAQIQREAINAKAGMWNNVTAYFKRAGNVVGNRRSKRFFTLKCKFSKEISKKNRVLFKSATDAFYNGYAPARVCKLWPEDTDIFVE
ncbi:thermonuclease family protein [Halodesulfovibrio marinisediminis]|uniref:Endonuclease YncB, thermonuclease family n=1 Tax=Halodesulfovibrio marinisediminis DSM 17456 TaxID=1121457 RepID=A0A1N6DYL7_9BACT|nr:thermonuclease family protein [Halodesulfovibrio marinisediminis]SIN75878.1 Endonuclease YncB, thermonuclease family [Halodesulfovibrio marinisediminis DSM 17456]